MKSGRGAGLIWRTQNERNEKNYWKHSFTPQLQPCMAHVGLLIAAEQIPFWNCSINSNPSPWQCQQYISNLSVLLRDGCGRAEIWKKIIQLKCVSSTESPSICPLSFPIHHGLNMDLFFLKHNWDCSTPPSPPPPQMQHLHNASNEHFVYMFNATNVNKIIQSLVSYSIQI